jgi:hypothetical protein
MNVPGEAGLAGCVGVGVARFDLVVYVESVAAEIGLVACVVGTRRVFFYVLMAHLALSFPASSFYCLGGKDMKGVT